MLKGRTETESKGDWVRMGAGHPHPVGRDERRYSGLRRTTLEDARRAPTRVGWREAFRLRAAALARRTRSCGLCMRLLWHAHGCRCDPSDLANERGAVLEEWRLTRGAQVGWVVGCLVSWLVGSLCLASLQRVSGHESDTTLPAKRVPYVPPRPALRNLRRAGCSRRTGSSCSRCVPSQPWPSTWVLGAGRRDAA
jgi:hypothetical protein